MPLAMGSPIKGRLAGRRKSSVLFVLVLLFYFGITQSNDAFTLATAFISSLVVALVFGHVTFERSPRTSTAVVRSARGSLYLIYLFWEIVKANFSMAYLTLHPALPIDPTVDRYDHSGSEPVELTALALSITLTPGTLVIDADSEGLRVHSLTPGAFENLSEGSLERGVSFVFHGRRSRADDVLRDGGRASNHEHPSTERKDPTDVIR